MRARLIQGANGYWEAVRDENGTWPSMPLAVQEADHRNVEIRRARPKTKEQLDRIFAAAEAYNQEPPAVS